jgi:hypothetical protein
MRTLLAFTILTVLAVFPPTLAARPLPVRNIYIESVVGGLDNDLLKIQLKTELERVGFSVSETRANADAVLSGTMSGWSEWSGTLTAFLVDRSGNRLWQASVPRTIHLGYSRCDPKDMNIALVRKLVKAIRSARIRRVGMQ